MIDDVAALEAIMKELPGSIPADQAEGLLVQIDPKLVRTEGATYSVQAVQGQDMQAQSVDTDRLEAKGVQARDIQVQSKSIGGERIVSGFTPYFQGNFSSLYYLPYRNYYFPYYRTGDIYLPMSILTHGDSRVYPFFRRQWGFFWPYTYSGLGTGFFLGVWSGTIGLMERSGLWGGGIPPVSGRGGTQLPPREGVPAQPAQPAEPAQPEPVEEEEEATPAEEPEATPAEEAEATPAEEAEATPAEEAEATPAEEAEATPTTGET